MNGTARRLIEQTGIICKADNNVRGERTLHKSNNVDK